MHVDVTSRIQIGRPREQVAAFAMDPDNAPKWYADIQSVKWNTPPPLEVGSRIAFVAEFLGRRLAYTYEIVTLVSGMRLVMRTSDGPFPMEMSFRWESTSDVSTRMTLRNRCTPTGFAGIIAAFMTEAAIRRANGKDLARLKQILEDRASDTT